MKLMILNCSGMTNISNSQYFAEKLIESFSENNINDIECRIYYVFNNDQQEIIKEVANYDAILFISPIYAGTVPSFVLDFMRKFERNYNGEKNKTVYAIDNCGLYQFRNNADIVTYRLWTEKVGLKWGGCFRISAGQLMLNVKQMPKVKGAHKDMFRKMNEFACKIAKREYVDLISYPVRFPRFVFLLLGNIIWYVSRKRGSFTPKYTIDDSK